MQLAPPASYAWAALRLLHASSAGGKGRIVCLRRDGSSQSAHFEGTCRELAAGVRGIWRQGGTCSLLSFRLSDVP